MKLKVMAGHGRKKVLEAAAVFLFAETGPATGLAASLDREGGGAIQDIWQLGDFAGRKDQLSVLYTGEKAGGVRRIFLIGLGKKEAFSRDIFRGAAAKAGQAARSHRLKDLVVVLDADYLGISWPEAAFAAVEGVMLGLYRFRGYKTKIEDDEPDLETLTILLPDAQRLEPVKEAAVRAQTISRAVYLTRNLVSMPSNELTPARLAGEAKALAKRYRGLSVRILEAREMERLGMNALLGVARGSRESPKLIVMSYRGADRKQRPLALVGKAITFDSGGISLKPAEKMEEMKSDMAGGAAVLGTLQAVAELKMPVNLVGIVPATENLPDGGAYKPGDILRTMSGKTVEVLNTDAEGRLILADALHYAQRYNPEAIIDIATLTGACVVALGNQVTGMMGTDEKLKELIRKAAEETGELVWELPLWENYQEMVKSDVADLKNSAGREGGAISAAAFLSKFADPVPWVHLDIAGTAWLTKDRPYQPKGASGIGVRLFVKFLQYRLEAG